MSDKAIQALNPKHFHLEYDDENIVWLGFDVADRSVNILTFDVLRELANIIATLTATPPAGLIVYSKKDRGFIFGADIIEFSSFRTAGEVAAHIETVLDAFQQIEDMQCPTAILIDGICVGGGFELALAFDRIIALENSQIGFPEINLGLLPGYGGTGRAHSRMGPKASLELVLSGRSLNGSDALESGAVDLLVADCDALMRAGRGAMNGQIARQSAVPCVDLAGLIAAEKAKVMARSRIENTPAPFAIIEHFEQKYSSKNNMIRSETKIFSELMMSSASIGLRRAFLLNDMVKKGGRGDHQVEHIHVIGAGVMGGDIAAVAAMSGFRVTLQDQNSAAIDGALLRAKTLYDRRLKSADKVAETMALLVADPEGKGVVKADLLIEAVAENLAIKQKVFADAEAKMKPDAIMATNTSAIPLEDIGAALVHPSRLIGMHFFNPVPVLPLVEIVYTAASNNEFVTRAMRVSGAMKKQPIRCKSSPGFLVNRALLPYVFNAIDDVLKGANPDKIDEAMVRYGMPMGPIEIADQIGIDVCHDAGMVLGISKASEKKLKDMVEKGTIGRKSGYGFYRWPDKKADRPRAAYDDDELQLLAAELLVPLIRECRNAVVEGVVDSADMADAACMFGIGYPSFTGGPLFWDEQTNSSLSSGAKFR